jgi:hypothetical protein
VEPRQEVRPTPACRYLGLGQLGSRVRSRARGLGHGFALHRSLCVHSRGVCKCCLTPRSLHTSLTPRSSGAPTAWRQAREAAVLSIICRTGLAPRCRCPLNSHVRRCPTQSAGMKAWAPSCSAPAGSGRGGTLHPTQARHGPAAETGRRCGSPARTTRPPSQFGTASSTLTLRPSPFLVRLGGAASEPVWFAGCGFVVGAAPNSAFKRTANSVAPWPRGRAVYHRPRGQGATLPAAA